MTDDLLLTRDPEEDNTDWVDEDEEDDEEEVDFSGESDA